MRILWIDTEPFYSPSVTEVSSVDLVPVYETGKYDVPTALFLEFDDEQVGEYPMDSTEKTFKDAVAAYREAVSDLFKSGYVEFSKFKAELL